MVDKEKKQGFSYPSNFDDDFENSLDFDFYPEDISILSEALEQEEKHSQVYDEEDSHLDEIIDYSDVPVSFEADDETDFSTEEESFEPLSEDSLDEILKKPLPKSSVGIEDEEGPIGLSEEELSKIESEDYKDYVDPDTKVDESFARELSELDEEDTDITLAEDELENILHSDYSDSEVDSQVFEESSVPVSPQDLIYQDEVSEEDNIEVDFETSPEVPVLFTEDSEEESVENKQELDEVHEAVEVYEEEEEDYGKSFFDSDEELEEESFEEVYDSEQLQEETFGEEKSFFEEEDESITLSEDELGNIVGEEEPVVSEEEGESITLSEDELGNIVGEEEPVVSEEEEESITLSEDELGNIVGEEEPLPDYGLYETLQEEDFSTEEHFQFQSVTKKDLQKLMSFLDEKLGSMPEEFVEEFAKSEYFELYKKIMNELDL